MSLIDRRSFVAGAGALSATTLAAKPRRSRDGIVNPLVRQRADAQVMLHDDWYYMTGSVPQYDRLMLRRSRTIAGLAIAGERVLWRHLASGPLSPASSIAARAILPGHSARRGSTPIPTSMSRRWPPR